MISEILESSEKKNSQGRVEVEWEGRGCRPTLLTSARLRTQSATSSGCFFHGDDIGNMLRRPCQAVICGGVCLFVIWGDVGVVILLRVDDEQEVQGREEQKCKG